MNAVLKYDATKREEEMRKQRFEEVMANIKPMMVEGTGKDQKVLTGSVVVPLDLCYVDEKYQGYRKHTNIKTSN